MTSTLSDRDRELLSALLDGRLSAQDKDKLTRRIAASTELAAEWDQLRHLRELMKKLPRHKARRSFLLKPGSIPVRKPSPLLFPMRLVSGSGFCRSGDPAGTGCNRFIPQRDACLRPGSRPAGCQRSPERGKSRSRGNERRDHLLVDPHD